MYMAFQTVMFLYASRRTTDTVTSLSHTAPIYEVYVLRHAIFVAGRDFTKNFTKIATERECPSTAAAVRGGLFRTSKRNCSTLTSHETELKSTAEFDP